MEEYTIGEFIDGDEYKDLDALDELEAKIVNEMEEIQSQYKLKEEVENDRGEVDSVVSPGAMYDGQQGFYEQTKTNGNRSVEDIETYIKGFDESNEPLDAVFIFETDDTGADQLSLIEEVDEDTVSRTSTDNVYRKGPNEKVTETDEKLSAEKNSVKESESPNKDATAIEEERFVKVLAKQGGFDKVLAKGKQAKKKFRGNVAEYRGKADQPGNTQETKKVEKNEVNRVIAGKKTVRWKMDEEKTGRGAVKGKENVGWKLNEENREQAVGNGKKTVRWNLGEDDTGQGGAAGKEDVRWKLNEEDTGRGRVQDVGTKLEKSSEKGEEFSKFEKMVEGRWRVVVEIHDQGQNPNRFRSGATEIQEDHNIVGVAKTKEYNNVIEEFKHEKGIARELAGEDGVEDEISEEETDRHEINKENSEDGLVLIIDHDGQDSTSDQDSEDGDSVHEETEDGPNQALAVYIAEEDQNEVTKATANSSNENDENLSNQDEGDMDHGIVVEDQDENDEIIKPEYDSQEDDSFEIQDHEVDQDNEIDEIEYEQDSISAEIEEARECTEEESHVEESENVDRSRSPVAVEISENKETSSSEDEYNSFDRSPSPVALEIDENLEQGCENTERSESPVAAEMGDQYETFNSCLDDYNSINRNQSPVAVDIVENQQEGFGNIGKDLDRSRSPVTVGNDESLETLNSPEDDYLSTEEDDRGHKVIHAIRSTEEAIVQDVVCNSLDSIKTMCEEMPSKSINIDTHLAETFTDSEEKTKEMIDNDTGETDHDQMTDLGLINARQETSGARVEHAKADTEEEIPVDEGHGLAVYIADQGHQEQYKPNEASYAYGVQATGRKTSDNQVEMPTHVNDIETTDIIQHKVVALQEHLFTKKRKGPRMDGRKICGKGRVKVIVKMFEGRTEVTKETVTGHEGIAMGMRKDGGVAIDQQALEQYRNLDNMVIEEMEETPVKVTADQGQLQVMAGQGQTEVIEHKGDQGHVKVTGNVIVAEGDGTKSDRKGDKMEADDVVEPDDNSGNKPNEEIDQQEPREDVDINVELEYGLQDNKPEADENEDEYKPPSENINDTETRDNIDEATLGEADKEVDSDIIEAVEGHTVANNLKVVELEDIEAKAKMTGENDSDKIEAVEGHIVVNNVEVVELEATTREVNDTDFAKMREDKTDDKTNLENHVNEMEDPDSDAAEEERDGLGKLPGDRVESGEKADHDSDSSEEEGDVLGKLPGNRVQDEDKDEDEGKADPDDPNEDKDRDDSDSEEDEAVTKKKLFWAGWR